MADEFSFDVVGKVDMQEVTNAVTQASKELSQRFDFKGSKSSIELNAVKFEITVASDDEHKLKSVVDILKDKFIKRKVSLKAMAFGKVEPASGGTVRQIITLQQGIATDKAKEITKLVKELGLKVQAEIQKDQVRVKGKKKDDLQAVMSAIKAKNFDFHVDFINYR